MKKVCLEDARQRSRLAWSRHISSVTRARRGYKIKVETVQIVPPKNFNLSDGYEATVGCLYELKTAALDLTAARRRKRIYIDFKPIKKISLAASVVLAAEIDRWRRHGGRNLQPRDLHLWDPEVKRRLSSLGFFNLLDLHLPELDQNDVENVTLLPLLSGQTLDREQLNDLLQSIFAVVAKVFKQERSCYEALIEAVYNTTKHAYPSDDPCEFKPLKNGWWAAAGWRPNDKMIQLWAYDQGVGIPATLPRSKYSEEVSRYLAKLPLVGRQLQDESSLIRAALEVDRTRLSGGHGQGLKDIIKPVQSFAGGKVRILSGRGKILHTGGVTETFNDAAQHLGGTLVEWTIPVETASG